MRQILFHIPFLNIPIYGYGLMLFLAFIFCTWLARRLCKREGIDGNLMPDLAIWLFISGILGGRLVFVATEWEAFQKRPLWDMVKLWDGGLVLYGALFGAAFGYFAYYHRVLRQHGVSHWKMLDVIAPCVALGIAFGRIGCLFTGCCYGNVACESCPAIHFPSPSPPWAEMVKRGYQTPLGFLFKDDSLEVETVEPGSPAANAGLKAKDFIVKANGKNAEKLSDVYPVAGVLQLTVFRETQEELPPFEPTSIGLNPTQPYETISMVLLLFFLLSYYPYKRHDSELMVFLMFGYGVHRFLNEMLRLDIDPGLFGLTMSQLISLGILAGGAVLAVIVWRRPLISATPPTSSPTVDPQLEPVDLPQG
jgi:prolipoprotein diacylglyceryltransferase